jgi:predicted nucleic acid-binding protein
MNGIDFIIDTNIFIYAMEGHPALHKMLDCVPAISVISEIELLGKKGMSSQETFNIRQLLRGFNILGLTNGIKEIAIDLKQRYAIKVPDAIIAATAKYYEVTLITADKDFRKIVDLDISLVDI